MFVQQIGFLLKWSAELKTNFLKNHFIYQKALSKFGSQ